ncbi:MAG: hypothetical protein HZB62_01970, partial [Nitrospirae bacterium]|nr:hypothetical protein [Nitrospirota bacterium]
TSVSGPVSGGSGQTITINSVVKNQGIGMSQGFSGGYYLSTDANITTSDIYVGGYSRSGLLAGEEWTDTRSVQLPTNLASGVYYIGAIADSAGVVQESNETNNSLAGNQITIAMPATAGPNSPTVAANNATLGTVAWTNPANVYTSNNVYATAVLGNNIKSQYLLVSGFNFAIPAGSTISGIVVSVERKEGMAAFIGIKDNSLRIVKGGVITGTEHAVTTLWGSTETMVMYGSSTDLWDTAWTEADINNPNFGVAISAKGSGTQGTDTASIDNVMITVYYTH